MNVEIYTQNMRGEPLYEAMQKTSEMRHLKANLSQRLQEDAPDYQRWVGMCKKVGHLWHGDTCLRCEMTR